MNGDITIRQCDDWIAVYSCGRKVFSNHSCGIREGLEALSVPHKYEDLYDDVDDCGELPNGEDAFPEILPGSLAAFIESEVPDPQEFWRRYREQVHSGTMGDRV